jgi:hypothetical protein
MKQAWGAGEILTNILVGKPERKRQIRRCVVTEKLMLKNGVLLCLPNEMGSR